MKWILSMLITIGLYNEPKPNPIVEEFLADSTYYEDLELSVLEAFGDTICIFCKK